MTEHFRDRDTRFIMQRVAYGERQWAIYFAARRARHAAQKAGR